jgi:hypothetical protein
LVGAHPQKNGRFVKYGLYFAPGSLGGNDVDREGIGIEHHGLVEIPVVNFAPLGGYYRGSPGDISGLTAVGFAAYNLHAEKLDSVDGKGGDKKNLEQLDPEIRTVITGQGA